jgi:hypothetical protein
MRKLVMVLVLVLSIATFVKGQDYDTGIGLRAGFSQGLTLKHFISRSNAVEGLLVTRWQGFDITGLYEIHNNAFDVDRLNWYYGFGGHLGSYNGDNVTWGEPGSQYLVIGVDGVLGLEYSFTEAPISIGIDLKPTLNLIGYVGFWADGGLSIRYIF